MTVTNRARFIAVCTALLTTLLASSAISAKVEPPKGDITYSKQQSKTALDIINKLGQRHYITQTLNDRMSSRIFDNYLKRLDGNKSLFLNADLEEFEQYRYTIDNTMNKGDLNPGYIIFNRYQQRLVARLNSIIEKLPELVASMDFERDESLELDRKETPWPTNSAEADELWRKIIKSRVISLRAANKEEAEIAPLLIKRYQNQLNRVQQSTSEDAFQIYMNSMTALYDPHTNYLSPTTSENFNINMSLSLEGIGAVLQTEDEFTKVVRLVHAGPADKQGQLQPSDRIVGVAQDDGEIEDVIGLRLDEVVKLIRGKKGSKVRLEVIPVSAKTDDEHKIIEIVRDTVKLEEQSAQKKVLDIYHNDKLSKIGIIDIPAFYIDFEAMRKGDPQYKSTTRDVSKLLSELIEEGVDGIIIDLRENGGGSLQEANQLTGLFIEQGPTVQIRHSNKQVYRDGKRARSPYYQGPLVVLINRLSASASEIFAGAIQDYQRGIVVGTQSFGKGTVQSLTPLKQGQLKITESKFYRISGESTQHRGVIPDIEFPAIYDKEKVGESSLDNALAWDRIDPIRHHRYFNLPAIMPQLKSKHAGRLKTDPDFIFLEAQLELLEESRAVTSISLNEKTRLAEQDEDKAKALVIENARRTAKGLDPLASLDEEEQAEEADQEVEDKTEEDEEEEIDPLLTEAGHILMDALPVYGVKKMATNP
ncbi:MAG: tail-specific protease [Oceanicoccus sp.]|uniref:carboxy terminal-processing peptidase n=1 Tax=Oceanicoccus sp. TaxID=2691044 RepID=UPI002636205D|nr:carboxy terminal-processing peptidase [Oceanicoccus sp.]MCP3908958.1 tail-specific protease [Oceanicoccus sp.]MDG1773353.1 carboxy terminal-processing peptidase [Oceanicoccus sp.]